MPKLTYSMHNVLEHLSRTDNATYGVLAGVGGNGANLAKMVDAKLLKRSEKKVPSGPPVKHWAITATGKKALKQGHYTAIARP